ncbi:hypothetical protein Lal_00043656 [Lupinus albus]|nr:hypothetical protein Lal_00043656 [Lupinus albus]
MSSKVRHIIGLMLSLGTIEASVFRMSWPRVLCAFLTLARVMGPPRPIISSMLMAIDGRNTWILHSINPEIDRTYHRLVRQNRTLDTNFVYVFEHLVTENTTSEHSVSVHSEYSDSMHSVAFPNFDHSVHSENMAHPPTPPGPHGRTLRELTAPDFTYDSMCIQGPKFYP